MKLFHCPPTRSQRALWALHEAGTPFDAHHVNLFTGEQNEDAYRAVQSRGVVPALETDDGVIVESSAIAMLIAEETPDAGLAPAPGAPDRARYLQWCVYAPAELDVYMVPITQNTMLLPEDQRDPQKVVDAKQQLASRLAFLAEGLGDGPYLLGDGFSMADVCVGHSLQWARMMGALEREAGVEAYLDRLSERPAFQKTYAG